MLRYKTYLKYFANVFVFVENRFFMKEDRIWKYRRGSASVESGYPKTLPSKLCGPTK